eukprot:5530108-Prymnesium_polylepis.3
MAIDGRLEGCVDISSMDTFLTNDGLGAKSAAASDRDDVDDALGPESFLLAGHPPSLSASAGATRNMTGPDAPLARHSSRSKEDSCRSTRRIAKGHN